MRARGRGIGLGRMTRALCGGAAAFAAGIGIVDICVTGATSVTYCDFINTSGSTLVRSCGSTTINSSTAAALIPSPT